MGLGESRLTIDQRHLQSLDLTIKTADVFIRLRCFGAPTCRYESHFRRFTSCGNFGEVFRGRLLPLGLSSLQPFRGTGLRCRFYGRNFRIRFLPLNLKGQSKLIELVFMICNYALRLCGSQNSPLPLHIAPRLRQVLLRPDRGARSPQPLSPLRLSARRAALTSRLVGGALFAFEVRLARPLEWQVCSSLSPTPVAHFEAQRPPPHLSPLRLPARRAALTSRLVGGALFISKFS